MSAPVKLTAAQRKRTWDTVLPSDFGVTSRLTPNMVHAMRMIATMGDVSFEWRRRRGLGISQHTINALVRRGICEHAEKPIGSGETTRSAIILSEWGERVIANVVTAGRAALEGAKP